MKLKEKGRKIKKFKKDKLKTPLYFKKIHDYILNTRVYNKHMKMYENYKLVNNNNVIIEDILGG